MDQEHKRLEFISRFVIFLPIIVLILAFFINSSSQKATFLAEQVTPTIISQDVIVKKKQSTAKTNMKLDLNGPYRCVYKDKTIDADISIKNKNVYAVYKTKNTTATAVLKGDCAYNWEQNKLTGEKMCGISQYISIFEMLSSWNIMSFDSLSSMISEAQPGMSIDSSVMSNIAESCKKEEVNDSLFVVPTTISFSDVKSISPSGL